MSKPSICLLVLSIFACSACAASDICKISGGKVEFLRDSKIIPYHREFTDKDWAAGEAGYEVAKRFPITGMVGETGKFDSKGMYAAAFPADYFPVQLTPVGNGRVFRIAGLMWTNYEFEKNARMGYIKKYSERTVEYHISFEGNPTCSEKSDLIVVVKADGKPVEKIFFHVKDMADAKDFWPEERGRPSG